jgi:chaperonin GroES
LAPTAACPRAGRPDPQSDEPVWRRGAKRRADRIGKHMSYQLLEEMDGLGGRHRPPADPASDRRLRFRKSRFDPLLGYNCSHMVTAKDFVVNYWTKDLRVLSARRRTS